MEDLLQELEGLKTRWEADHQELQHLLEKVAQPATSVVIQRERRLRHYSGVDSDTSLVDWTEEARACIAVQGLTGRAAANFVVSYLEGAARIEMQYQSDEVRKDAERIFVALDEVYGEKSSSSQLLRAFYERSQTNSETISEFSHGLVELPDRLQRVAPGVVHDRNRMLREQLIENVRDVHLRWDLKRRVEHDPAVTFLDVRKVAIMWAEEVEAAAPRKLGHVWRSGKWPLLVHWIKCGKSWVPRESYSQRD